MRIQLIIIICLLVSACSTNDDEFIESFKNVETIELTAKEVKVDQSSLILSYMFEMEYVDSLLIINEYPDKDYCLKIVDLKTGTLRPFAKKGKGPNEIQAQSCNYSVDQINNELYITDRNTYYVYSIDSLMNEIIKPTSSFSVRIKNIPFLSSSYCSNKIIGSTYENKLGVYDINSDTCFTKYKYANDPLIEQGRFCCHPTKQLAVFFQAKSAIMDIFEIKDNDVLRKEFVWWSSAKKDQRKAIPVKTRKNGFITASSSEKFIYSLYSGKMVNTQSIKTLTDAFLSQYVYVFDWDGKPNKVYKLDQDVRSIAIDDKNNILYAASYKGDIPNIVKYQL